MENQHRKITGYRELTKEEIDLMNRIKAIGPELEAHVDAIHIHLNDQITDSNDLNVQFEPYRWLFEGKTQLQLGLMCLTRAVAQPTSF